ncbi:hypothetical protein SSP35_04_03660 [Streptomyces sp. NBRC 110611]|uniref:DUF5134 domain-containing protein n=1 Tax=Streptomyces sp. NBRC 110611 TaxID=1621259 RepID=UPI00083345E3|nr:DUF5134 domain-containing protein [Streptomyces sp. NBRC 110611]GAU67280.1 hypothetical protein SSP35_04_03660 [Streptomyces sp. NBRC 110611]
MHGPPLVGWLLVLVCAGPAAYFLSRPRAGAAARRAEARLEGLIALGMAAMALPVSVVAQSAWSPWLFAVAFGAAGVWALARRHPHHTVEACAMVYMALAMTGHGHGGGVDHAGALGGAGQTASYAVPMPLLTGVSLAYFTVYVLSAGIRLVPATTGTTDAGSPDAASAGVVRACRIAMGIAMLAMLLAM